MNNLVLKPIAEATYLTVENAWRYRAILRYFYEQHERMRQFLFPEEIYHFLKEHEAFREYTMDMLQNDLDQLVKWKNLIARQETGRVRTIEEFKKKRFRYQCSPYTVEFERTVKSLENMGGSFGGSLEKTLFDRLYEAIKKIHNLITSNKLDEIPLDELFRNWEDVFDYYKKMYQNSADYIAYVSSENVEEKMQTESFLLYKDSFTEYLRDFIISLQQTSLHIELQLEEINEEAITLYIRYQEARKDAPYIISLDEAFAGVDENNIRDMFELVEELGFNYIMNSQAIWGDYDTVSKLSISELVRPKNAPFVTVIRYYWNGKVRALKLDEWEEEELKV